MRRMVAMVGPVWIAGAAACSGASVEPSGTVGELGEGVFRYDCIEDGDAVCNVADAVDTVAVSADLGLSGETPEAIAVGARFDLTYFGDSSDDDLLLVETEPARPDAVSTTGGFVIGEPGVHAFLARSPKGIVADFMHVEALVATDLDVWMDEQRIEAFDMAVDTEEVLAVVPSDDSGVSLGGALPYTWEVTGAAVAIDSVMSTSPPSSTVEINDDEIRVYALEQGTASIRVARGELERVIDVTVGATQ